jgi:hypothetical protein
MRALCGALDELLQEIFQRLLVRKLQEHLRDETGFEARIKRTASGYFHGLMNTWGKDGFQAGIVRKSERFDIPSEYQNEVNLWKLNHRSALRVSCRLA